MRAVLTRHRRMVVVTLALALAVAAPWLALAGWSGYLWVSEWTQRQPFDSAAWQQSLVSAPREPIRLRMVDDLLQRHRLVGMRRQEVIALLGTPPATPYFRDHPLVYWLGPERGMMGIDSEWLAIRFNAQDVVIEARVLRD